MKLLLLALLMIQGSGGVVVGMQVKPVCKKVQSSACSGCTDGTLVLTCVSGSDYESCSTSTSLNCEGSGHLCRQSSGGSACSSSSQ